MTNKNRDKTISEWAQLVDCVGEYRDGWIFRGESDPDNEKLTPLVGRYSTKRGSPRKYPYTREDELQAFEEFRRAARPYLNHQPKSDIEWLSIAQHHGVPTRLLDWTESLLVAAFFAVKEAGIFGDEGERAVIYAVKGIGAIDEAKESPFSLKEVKTYKPPHISPRIPAQNSVFTIQPNPTKPFSFHSLERWVLHSKALCWDVKRNLAACGVNESSVYPDIDGLCKYVAWRYKWAFFQSS
ncbi:MAG: FRG domain-containing protein [Gammaproteobacteria bacterium]|nr:FRG domain-containing protein [Gammaproteobacteria bacterium]MCI0591673.1 FRG domain-containing protein [Gammaproteobacteria bacterium]